MIGGGDGQIFLAFKVMKKAALGQVGGSAEIINAGVGVTLATDDVQSHIENFSPGWVRLFIHKNEHTNWLVFVNGGRRPYPLN